MVTGLSVYRNAHGDMFYRTSPTCGRTGSYRIKAATVVDLDGWLTANGFLPAGAKRAA